MDLGSPNPAVQSRIDRGTKPHATYRSHSLGSVSIDAIPTQLIQNTITGMIDPASRLLTPNTSEDEGSPPGEQIVSVSSSFYPGAHDANHNIVLRTNDLVLFYLNSTVLQAISTHAFGNFLRPIASGSAMVSPSLAIATAAAYAENGQEDVIDIPESSATLNVIAHALYDTSCARHAPALDTIEEAIDRMPSYGIIPALHVIPGKELYNLLLTHAPVSALRVYALAAKHKLHELARQASAHTLSLSMSLVTDELAQRMGSVYLKNLMLLHMARKEAFKTIILPPPEKHVPTQACPVDDQRKLHRAWALAAAYLAWDGRIDVPSATLQKTFMSLEENLECETCKTCLRTRVKDVVVQWAAMKVGGLRMLFSDGTG
ncbi:hypothetical protein BKA70DRAFT_1436905 [Coprinopsis sp. MPI-PUGE-AT-0042]|nr:hypothetical protein BKA70DRAFT_1436905 [Coprinopsis sp. MPI-PUGE-AT-0042]